jgi:hypothetical protein
MSITRTLVVTALSVSLVLNPAAAMCHAAGGSSLQDVQLSENGVVVTRVVDLQGNPVANERVTILFQDREIASAISDADGLVAISGLKPGIHAISTQMGATVCRFWSGGTAPPSAVMVPAVVSDVEIVRAQFGGFNLPMAVYATVSFVALGLAIDAKDTADSNESAVRRLDARVAALETAS